MSKRYWKILHIVSPAKLFYYTYNNNNELILQTSIGEYILKTNEQVICPKCKNAYRLSIWHRLNTKEHPICKSKIINDTFFRKRCPHCGAEIYIYNDIVIEDTEEDVLIFYSNNPMLISAMENSVNQHKLKPQFEQFGTIRVVNSPDVLREKMRIFSQGKDDRIIELIKLSFLNELHEKGMTKQVRDVLCWVEDNGDMTFDFFGQENGQLQAQAILYDMMYDKYKDMLTTTKQNNATINIDWAIEFLEIIETR